MVGKNEARWNRWVQYGQISIFERKEDLMNYEQHPEHKNLVRKIAGGNAMDFIPLDT